MATNSSLRKSSSANPVFWVLTALALGILASNLVGCAASREMKITIGHKDMIVAFDIRH